MFASRSGSTVRGLPERNGYRQSFTTTVVSVDIDT